MMRNQAGRILPLFGLATLIVVVGLGIWGHRTVTPLATVGTANKAKLLCSAVFVGGRNAEEVLQAELGTPALARVRTNVDSDTGTVTASMFWVRAEVVYRPDVGCTRIVDGDAETLLAQIDLGKLPVAPDLSAQPWPTGDAIDPDRAPDFDRAALDELLATAFDGPDTAAPIGTRAIAVVWRGELIGERYAPGFTAETPLTGWSMTKSLTNALIGLRVGDGALALDEPASVPEWQGRDDPRRGITLDQLLRASSALEFGEVYTGTDTDAVQMLFGIHGEDMGGFAARKPLLGSPDSRWSYSSGTTNLLQRILRDSFDDLESYHRFVRERLLYPIGMIRTSIMPDPSGTLVGSSFGYGPARDWARFGLLFLQDGIWEGERLLPEGWVNYSVTPTPADPEGRYGAQWWLNVGHPDRPQERPWPQLPTDVYRASGFEGQYVVVVPSHDLVVVRLGYTPERGRWDMADFTVRVMAVLDAAAGEDSERLAEVDSPQD